MVLSEKLPNFQSQWRPACASPVEAEPAMFWSCGGCFPWKPATGGAKREWIGRWYAALPLISHGVRDLSEQNYYRDLDVSCWGQMRKWLIANRLSGEPSLLGFWPPSTNLEPGMRSFPCGNPGDLDIKNAGSRVRLLGLCIGSTSSELCVLGHISESL